MLIFGNSLTYEWEFVDEKNVSSFRNSAGCTLSHRFLTRGNYWVNLKIYSLNENGAKIKTEVAEFRKFFLKIQKFWIVAIGDSFASGQGNPDVPATQFLPPKWLDPICFRSAKGSWPFEIYKKFANFFQNRSIFFTFLACSGASLPDGILGPINFNQSNSVQAQIDVLKSIVTESGLISVPDANPDVNSDTKPDTNPDVNPYVIPDTNLDAESGAGWIPFPVQNTDAIPDAILLSIGGNDVDFSKILFSMLRKEKNFHKIYFHFFAVKFKFKSIFFLIKKGKT